jgi:two-component system cell cycle sensor histidine kinase/response regulator CckA
VLLAARQEERGAEFERVFNVAKYSYGVPMAGNLQEPESVAAELQAILDAAMDVVVVFDSERRFLSVNDAACRFYGRPRERLIGARLDDLIGSERAQADWEGFLSEERIAQGTLEHVWEGEQDGRRRVLEVRSRPEFLPGRHLFVLRDVTERRRLEDQLRQAQKMEAVGQLAGGVAHDFNNLLTVIGGYTEIARRRIGAGPGGAELLEVERATERATQLTRQLLAFSRQQILDPAPLDLGEVASALVPMLRRLIGEDIEIAMLAAPGLPSVLADRSQIEQVILNLSVNARDAMPSGGTLTIETRAVRDRVALIVTDTGVGMTRETLDHVFEPFFTTKETGRGTGLGLAMVHGIVTQSGGEIVVYSEPDLGTSFKVYLPISGDAAAPAAADAASEIDQLRGDETVLVCEDEAGVRHLIEYVLTSHGYTVLATDGPLVALERAAEHAEPIDLLISDVIMPDLSGPELARRLESVRTLFVSGYTAETVSGRGRLPADSAFLEKPFDQLSLLRAVRALLDQPATRAR